MRFLVVDDDESVLLYLDSLLKPYVECDLASSGEESLKLFENALLEKRPYDVVMMDILMPGMDGHQTAEIMRNSEKQKGISEIEQFKLVMVTALVDDTNMSRAFIKTHATCYIVKPLERRQVLEELRQNFIL